MLKIYYIVVIVLQIPVLLLALVQIFFYYMNKKMGADGETSICINIGGVDISTINIILPLIISISSTLTILSLIVFTIKLMK